MLGGVVRDFFNARNAGRTGNALLWQWPIAIILAVALIILTAWKPDGDIPLEGKVLTPEALAIVQVRCTPCHSARPSDEDVGVAPGGIKFDDAAMLKAHAAKVLAQSVLTDAMPIGNKTEMTAEERAQLGTWIRAGMPDE